MSMRSRIVVAAVVPASLVQPLSAQRGNSVPSVSVRPPDFIYKITAGAALPSLGWKIRQYDAIFLNSTTCHAQRETPAVIV